MPNESEKNFWGILLVVAGLLGIIWFFMSYSSLDPVRVVDDNLSKEEVLSRVDATMRSWQTIPEDLKSEVKLDSYRDLVDSLQQSLNGESFVDVAQSAAYKEFPFFYWQVDQYERDDFYEGESTYHTLRATTAGEVFSFSMNLESVKESNPYNARVIDESLGLDSDLVFENQALKDSLIADLLKFQSLESLSVEIYSSIEDKATRLGAEFDSETEDIFLHDKIWKGAREYIQDTYWSRYSFAEDSLAYQEIEGVRFVRLFFSSQESVMGFKPSLTIDLLPAGGVKAIRPGIKSINIPENGLADIVGSVLLFAFLCFAIWLVSVFYLRIKASAIDTQPAFVVAVMGGFLLSVAQLLRRVNNFEFNSDYLKHVDISQELFLLGMLGAVSAVILFVLTSVSDSITRQHWPEKLKSWDLARRGFFKNKPVGNALLYSICIAGLLVGIWTILLKIFPGIYVRGKVELSSVESAFPLMTLTLENILASILLVISFFLILGNQFYALTGKKWIIPIISGIAFSIFLEPIASVEVRPVELSVAINAALGIILGVFYLRYGFLTILLSFFVFTGFLTTKNGWLIPSSPDASIFYTFVGVVISMASVGFYFVQKGSEKKDLPDYIPEYIEQQAQGERLNQELQIARIVQTTFLPKREVHLPGIDIAGICDPAQETGGDYYDMIELGKNRTAIAIGDVSGKGIQAAFYMTFVKGVLHSLSALILSPLELLNQLNRLFKENATRGTFITMIYGILEADKRTFTFSRAGHNPMLLVRANGDVEWPQSKGVGIGITATNMFSRVTEEVELKLKEGDVAILYTDGITEMMNISNQFYGEDRLERLVKGIRKATSSKILEIIIEDVREFKGVAKQHDDMTLVVIKADSSVNK